MYTLLADYYGHWGGGGPWFLVFPLFWLIVIFVVLFLLRRAGLRRGFCSGARGPLATLGDRYANGEITADEYRERRAVLMEHHEGGGAK